MAMPSRLRATKKKGVLDLPEWLDRRAQSIEVASDAVERVLVQLTRQTRKQGTPDLAYLRREDLVRGPDGRELSEGGFVPIAEPPEAMHTGTVHAHELLRVGPADAVAELRALADFFRHLQEACSKSGLGAPFELSSLKKRGKGARGTERTNVQGSVKKLVQWLVKNGGAPFLSVEAQATAHHDRNTVHALAMRHLHRGASESCEHGEQCKVLAVTRALSHLLDGLDLPLTPVIRDLANSLFSVAGELEAVNSRASSQNPKIEPDTALGRALARMLEIALELRGLDQEIRLACCRAPYDHAPRGQHPKQALLIGATLLLKDGGFSDDQIGEFLDDGFAPPRDRLLDEGVLKRRRAKRVRARLDENWVSLDRVPSLDEQRQNCRTMFAKQANAEQIARAIKEPDLLWKNGKAYRRVDLPGAPPFLQPC